MPEISFATYMAGVTETKGTMTNTPAALADVGGFNVWAIGHTDSWIETPTIDKTSVMNNVSVTSPDGVSWSYEEEIMWPMDRYVSFFAYGPNASATVTNPDSDGTPMILFSVKPIVKEQADLLIATSIKNQAGAWYNYGKPVNLFFKHALSRISFSGLLTDPSDTRKVTVTKIVLNGLYSSGITNLTTPVEWEVEGSPTSSYTLNVSDKTTIRELVETQLTNEGVALTAENGFLFLMPQTIARPDTDPTMDVSISVIDGNIEYTYDYTSIVFSPDSWEPGKSYNYQIVLNGNDLRIIHVDSDIEIGEWSPSLVLQTVTFSSTEYNPSVALQVDLANLYSAINNLDTINKQSSTHRYRYYGVYGVNDISHDIEIDLSYLKWEKKVTEQYPEQYLMFDFKKLIRNWNTNKDDSDRPWEFKISGYEDQWELERAKQAIDKDNPDYEDIDWAKSKVEVVDGVTYATLPAKFPSVNPPDSIEVKLQNPLKNKGSIILRKR